MIEQQGRVVGIDGEFALVRLGGRSGCAACDAGQGCGAGLFGRLLNRSRADLQVLNRLELDAGAPVLIGLAETTLLNLVMRLYGWPLLAGLAAGGFAHGALVALGVGPGILSDGTVLLAGIVTGGLVLRSVHRGAERSFTPRSLEMLDADIRLECGSFDRIP